MRSVINKAGKLCARRNEIAHGMVQNLGGESDGYVVAPSYYATNKKKLGIGGLGAIFVVPTYQYSSIEVDGFRQSFVLLYQECMELLTELHAKRETWSRHGLQTLKLWQPTSSRHSRKRRANGSAPCLIASVLSARIQFQPASALAAPFPRENLIPVPSTQRIIHPSLLRARSMSRRTSGDSRGGCFVQPWGWSQIGLWMQRWLWFGKPGARGAFASRLLLFLRRAGVPGPRHPSWPTRAEISGSRRRLGRVQGWPNAAARLLFEIG